MSPARMNTPVNGNVHLRKFDRATEGSVETYRPWYLVLLLVFTPSVIHILYLFSLLYVVLWGCFLPSHSLLINL